MMKIWRHRGGWSTVGGVGEMTAVVEWWALVVIECGISSNRGVALAVIASVAVGLEW